jgi:periplasmic protein TonB
MISSPNITPFQYPDAPAFDRSMLKALLRTPLGMAIVLSTALHLLVLMVRFVPPPPLVIKPNDAQLEVVLLNAQTDAKPTKAEVLAQVNMLGGGDKDRGRAKSPLPAEAVALDGTEVLRRRARVEELETQQRRLIALAKSDAPPSPELVKPREVLETPGVDPADTQAVIARLQAEISKSIEDYNKRPRRLTYGINAVGVDFARYVDAWADKVERLGTERYPKEARGKFYDSLILTVEIDKFGMVQNVAMNKRSKFEALNKAAREIVYAGQPYDKFPPEMIRQGDILQIVRTWYFTNDQVTTESVIPAAKP